MEEIEDELLSDTENEKGISFGRESSVNGLLIFSEIAGTVAAHDTGFSSLETKPLWSLDENHPPTFPTFSIFNLFRRSEY